MKKVKNTYEILKDIKAVFLSHPDVNEYMYGVYKLGDTKNIKYPIVALTKENISNVNNSILSMTFNILYADRLTDSRDNMEYIEATGESVILECLNYIRNCGHKIGITDVFSIRPFTEQFADNCAGVVTTITIQFPSFIGQCDWIKVDECLKCK